MCFFLKHNLEENTITLSHYLALLIKEFDPCSNVHAYCKFALGSRCGQYIEGPVKKKEERFKRHTQRWLPFGKVSGKLSKS